MHLRSLIALLILSTFYNSYAQNSRKDNIIGSDITIQSKILEDERVIQVYLPDEYLVTDERYPVLYVLDGQRYFLHGVSLQKSSLEFEQTPGYIIVGISKKPSDRNRNFNVNSAKYLAFIKQEVITYIDKEFRTSEKRMIFGWAFGGGFVIETLYTEPDLFDVYIAASPFPLTEKLPKIKHYLKKNPTTNKVLYFSSGTKEGLVQEGTHALNSYLIDHAPTSLKWTFRSLDGEEHRSTPFTTLYHGIKAFFSYYPELQFSSLEEFSNAGGLTNVYQYYAKRASIYGFPETLSDWTMFSITRNAIRANNFKEFDTLVNAFKKTGYLDRIRASRSSSIAEFYLKNKHYNTAIELFTRLTVKHPTEVRPLKGLGDAYTGLKKKRKAAKYYKKAEKIK